ncbi:MAG: PadR family transcriptional regulator [Lachnospiraceae bacterium]|jgi:DNA-binding PadR family transcriptional regulator|nr:PadR family transcriptional regulator [Lachnospiraceae bacterium]MBR5339766.1 PadR family transcriptional regulator [Lachnospiraceae bacterium]
MKRVEPLSESYYYILLCLAKGANHGYGIMQLTEKLSGGDVTIGSGTMYGATSNMMKKGWIREIMSDEPGLERRRLYQLTESGREVLRLEISRLRRMLENAEEV